MATLKVNRIGLEPQVYKGGKTTLCAGCGHNAISERIIDAFFEMGVDPRGVVKLSGVVPWHSGYERVDEVEQRVNAHPEAVDAKSAEQRHTG